jgi:hypothetical protein
MTQLNGSHLHSPYAGFHDPIVVNRVLEVVKDMRERRGITTNLAGGIPDRLLWQRNGGTGLDPDPRRSLEDEYGWPVAPGPELYDRLYNWDSFGARVVALPPSQCWKVDPEIYETEDEDDITDFEESVDNMVASLRGEDNFFRPQPGQGGNPVFAACRALDILGRRGRYGAMWIGLDDDEDPRTPVPGLTENHSFPVVFKEGEKEPTWVKGKPGGKRAHVYNQDWDPTQNKGRKLLFLRPYPESQAKVLSWEGNRSSSRYCQPLEYMVTELDPSSGYWGTGLPVSTQVVHWSRMSHYADTYHHAVGGAAVLATPGLQVPLYDILDARKVSGASPEGYYRAVIARLFFETLPQFGADVNPDYEEIRDMMEEIDNGMQKHGVLKGLHANQPSTQVNDPTPHLDAKYKRIAMLLGKPKRILEGSERGELSSGQDERQDADEIAGRQNSHLSPHMLAPLHNRLIRVGVLVPPDPDEGYKIKWPPVHLADENEESQVFLRRSQAFAAAFNADVPSHLGEKNFFVKEAGYEPDEADEMLKDAEKQALQDEKDAQKLADKHGMVPEPPPGFQHPPEPPQQPGPITVGPGQALVHPQTGAVVGKSPFPPKQPTGGK